jgi:HEPN domain-containing protein
MSLKKALPGSPEEWLARAKSNLTRAKQPKPDEVYWEDICFDAQQAAEKSLKALLIRRDIPFRFVHDIGELVSLLQKSGMQIPSDVQEAVELTEYAVEARYPGPFEPVTESEAETAIERATAVVDWVQSLI